VSEKLPPGWKPDFIVLSLSYSSIPAALYQAPVPIIGLAPDWNLLWSCYRHVLPRCDAVFTDSPGVERFRQAGFDHVRGANLFGDTDQKKRASFDHLIRATGEGLFGLFQESISRTVSFVVSFHCLIRSSEKSDSEGGKGTRVLLVFFKRAFQKLSPSLFPSIV
jgi:hypothetical protein